MIWEFRYREKFGVAIKHLEADDLAQATDKAQRHVAKIPGALCIPNSVAPWLVAEDDDATAQLEAAAVQHKPSVAEQRANLEKAARERKQGGGVGSEPKADGRVGA